MRRWPTPLVDGPLASEQLRKHFRGPAGAVGFDRREAGWPAQRRHDRVSDDLRRRRRVVHADARPVTVEAVSDMVVLLEMILERKIKEWHRSGRELHAGGKAALHQRQVAGSKMTVEIGHE